MPSYQDLEDALDALETYVAAQIPIISQSLQRLTDDLRRFGPPQLPPLPDMPSFPLFASVPPPPPPPPPPMPLTFGERAAKWAGRNKYALIGGGAVVGLGLAATSYRYMRINKRIVGVAQGKRVEGKEVVVVLGADSHLGPLVVADLRSRGYIVIASVASPEAIPELDRNGKGCVKALVLDPYDPSSTAPFLRSLQSTLSLKFPLAPGDPYRSSALSELPAVVSVVSLLSLTPPNVSPMPTPGVQSMQSSTTSTKPPHLLSTLSISKDYLPYLIATHLTPLTIIQSVLPLFRASNRKNTLGSQPSLVIALPGGAASAGIVGQDASPAMASAAMAKASEILRRELSVSSDLTGTRVVVIDVGEVSANSHHHHHHRSSSTNSRARKPTDAKRFSEAVGRVVSGGRRHAEEEVGTTLARGQAFQIFLQSLGLSLQDWWRGDRFSIGAGAAAYSLAAYLPLRLLDAILLLPERLLAYRDRMRRHARMIAKERKRRQKEHDRARSAVEDSETESSTGREIAIVSSITSTTPSVHLEGVLEDEDVLVESDNISVLPPSPSSGSAPLSRTGSEPDLDGRPVSVRSHEDDDHHGAIAESWVLDVDPNAEIGRPQSR